MASFFREDADILCPYLGASRKPSTEPGREEVVKVPYQHSIPHERVDVHGVE